MRPANFWIFAGLPFLALQTGCPTQADMQYVQRDVVGMRSQMADLQTRMSSLQNEVDKLRGEIERLQFAVGSGGSEAEAKRLMELESRLARLESGEAAFPGEEVAPRGAGEDGESEASTDGAPDLAQIPQDAPSAYREALESLRAGDAQGAIRQLREFLRRSPKDPWADDAQYMIGEAYFSNRDYNRAVLEFNETLLRYPRSDLAPLVLLREGVAFSEMGSRIDARLVYQKLVSEYPSSPHAESARARLNELGAR